MRLIEIAALENGAHRNQELNGVVSIPEGWAVIPDEMEIPSSFPFVDITVEEVTHYRDVEVVRDVTKTREVESFDEEGNPITVTEEYTEMETVTEIQEYTMMTVVSMTEGTLPDPEPVEPEVPETDNVTWDAMAEAIAEGVNEV